jgi:hypothetical protein
MRFWFALGGNANKQPKARTEVQWRVETSCAVVQSLRAYRICDMSSHRGPHTLIDVPMMGVVQA